MIERKRERERERDRERKAIGQQISMPPPH